MSSVPGEECPQVTTYKLLRLSLVPTLLQKSATQSIQAPSPAIITESTIPELNPVYTELAPRFFFLFPHHPTVPFTDGNLTPRPVFPSTATLRLFILISPMPSVSPEARI